MLKNLKFYERIDAEVKRSRDTEITTLQTKKMELVKRIT